MTQEVLSHMPEETPTPDVPVVDAPVVDPVTPAVDTPASTEPVVDPATPPADADTAGQGIETLPEWAQKELRQARDDAAKYRTGSKPYREAFEAFDEPSQQVLLGLVQSLAQDPKAGAQEMIQLAQALLGEDGANVDAELDADPDRPMTRAEYDQLRQQEARQAAEAKALADLDAEASSLGYTRGTRQYGALLWEAKANHNGDLKAAHEALEAERAADRKAAIEEYLTKKKQDAQGTPTAGSGTGVAAGGGQDPRDLKSARSSLESRLDAVFGGVGQ